MAFDSHRQARVDARFWTLRSLGMAPADARQTSKMLEYRCMCHERLGGVTMIYSDIWLDAGRWSDLYLRVAQHLNGKHAARMYDVLTRLELSVC